MSRPELHLPSPRRACRAGAALAGFPVAPVGASLAELMNRVSHSSTRAALVYLHAKEEPDREVAETLNEIARCELKRSARGASATRSGTERARGRPKWASARG